MKLAWTPKSLRKFKRLIRKNPQLKLPIDNTLRKLTQDPFHFILV
jgi:Txe/YoeB family toxin of Txe-Axe toxin-antitoxin module